MLLELSIYNVEKNKTTTYNQRNKEPDITVKIISKLKSITLCRTSNLWVNCVSEFCLDRTDIYFSVKNNIQWSTHTSEIDNLSFACRIKVYVYDCFFLFDPIHYRLDWGKKNYYQMILFD